jgi:hypothetical protein
VLLFLALFVVAACSGSDTVNAPVPEPITPPDVANLEAGQFDDGTYYDQCRSVRGNTL